MRYMRFSIALLLSAITGTAALKCLFMGNSFFVPISKRMNDIAELADDIDHIHLDVFSGGDSGAPSALWNNNETREEGQTYLDGGDIDLFGLTVDTTAGQLAPTLEGYERWIDYALARKSDTIIMFGPAWVDYPSDYNTSQYTSFVRDYYFPLLNLTVFAELQKKYPDATFLFNPYALGVVEARLLFEAGGLQDVTSLFGECVEDETGQSTCGEPGEEALFTDHKGHGGDFLRSLLGLIWLNRIYNVDLGSFDVVRNLGRYKTDITSVAKAVLDAYDNGDFCGTSMCSTCDVTTPCFTPPPMLPPSPPSAPSPPPCIDDPPSQYGPNACSVAAAKDYCTFWNITIRNLVHLYCPKSCRICPDSEINFALAQAAAPSSSTRVLSEAAPAPPSPSAAAGLQKIRTMCAPAGAADLDCVELEVMRLLQRLQVNGLLTVRSTGSLSNGDWRVEVDLVANEQCAEMASHIRPRASLVLQILYELDVPILYQVPLTCRTSATEPVAGTAIRPTAATERQWQDLATTLQVQPLGLGSSCPSEGDSDGLRPATIGLLVTTVLGWLLAAALAVALARKKGPGASAPRDATGVHMMVGNASASSTGLEKKSTADYA